MNKSKDLSNLFKDYLNRKKEESSRPHVQSYNKAEQRSSYFQDGSNCVIYFFEWSDPHREPKRFLSLKEFNDFMKDCGIYLNYYENSRLINWKLAYVICKKGSKELIISPTYEVLLKDIIDLDNGRNAKEPYNVQCTHPPMYRQ